VWLCKPGLAANPCEPDLSTTVFTRYDGAGVVTHPSRTSRRFDCFYVYPTVSDQAGPNANLSIDPEERSIALYQASRFSQLCRVYAPVYRQLTVPSLAGTVTAAAAKLAYGDVLAAWKEYLAKYNKGRGVVLIGHSQGAGHLQELIRTQIDGRPVSRRLISAILLGGNVLVRRGSDTGGVFEHIRACRSTSQLGCVVAFSTYNQTPPKDTLFGRSGRSRFAKLFHLPTGKRYEVLCTNPGDLARNRSVAFDSIVPSAPFAPGTLIAAGISVLGFTPPAAATTYIEGRGLFSGRCSSAGVANVLRVRSQNGTPTLRPSPDPTWGLHLIDANIAQGELVDLVRAEAARYAVRRARARASG